MRVDLGEQEWNQILALLSEAPWKVANPLLMKIGEQLRPRGLHEDGMMNQAGAAAPGRPNGPLEASEGHRIQDPGQRPS